MRHFLLALVIALPWTLAAQTPINESELKALASKEPATVILDVRTADEFAGGHLPGALLLPFDDINPQSAGKVLATKTTPVVVYCRSGRRSSLAAQTLKSLGYTRVWDLGAIGSWTGPLVR